MTEGWIKLYRASFDNQLYFKEKFTDWQAWVDLLLLANHKDGYFKCRGVRVYIKRGQVGFSTKTLAKRWKWSAGKVLRFISFLEQDSVSQISTQKNNITTLITILNYNNYQANGIADNTASSATNGSQTETNKNDKEEYSNLLVKINLNENEKKVNRDSGTGHSLYTDKYGSEFPKIDY